MDGEHEAIINEELLDEAHLSLKQWLVKKLRLRVNEEKSGVRPASRSH